MRPYSRLGGFVSDDAQRQYLAAYDRAMALSPVDLQPVDIETPFGTTRVYVAGPQGAAPLVLLHCKSGSATMWLDQLPALTHTHRAYVVDSIGDFGRSVPTRMMHGSADIVRWLDAVLGALDVEQCAFVGLSNGGFQAATYAMARPDRVERVALLAPAGVFVRFRLAWWRAVMPVMIGTDRTKIERAWRIHSVAAVRSPLHEAFDDQAVTGFVGARNPYRDAFPRTYKARKLAALTMPVLFVVGEHEVINDPEKVTRRVREVLPSARVEVLADCGHFINFDQPSRLVALLSEFLDPTAGASPRFEQ